MKKNIIFTIIGFMLGLSVAVGATILYNAKDIEFNPSDASWNVNNVKDAIIDLNNYKKQYDLNLLDLNSKYNELKSKTDKLTVRLRGDSFSNSVGRGLLYPGDFSKLYTYFTITDVTPYYLDISNCKMTLYSPDTITPELNKKYSTNTWGQLMIDATSKSGSQGLCVMTIEFSN